MKESKPPDPRIEKLKALRASPWILSTDPVEAAAIMADREARGDALEAEIRKDAGSGRDHRAHGHAGGEERRKRAQKDYQNIRKEFARVSLNEPNATKKTRMARTAKHLNVSVSKVRDALKEKTT